MGGIGKTTLASEFKNAVEELEEYEHVDGDGDGDDDDDDDDDGEDEDEEDEYDEDEEDDDDEEEEEEEDEDDEDDEEVYEYSDKELLKERVYKHLKGRRYLVVMDEMWDTNVWDDLRRMCPDDINGSRIIITTREMNVASYIISVIHPYQMRLMSVDQSWSLLKERVFGKESCPLEIEKIGQVVAEKCRGLPLAIIVIAGVVSREVIQRKDSWEKIAGNVHKLVSSNDEHYIEILSLSYMYLPNCLRPCFLDMGCFPEDYEINVSKLIRLWVAEGFLTPNGSKDMEELGYEYLEDLAARSLVLIHEKGSTGKIRTVKIHDLLRDLCIRKCRDHDFSCTITEFSGSFPQGIENSNRLSIVCNVFGCIPNMETSPLHTILLFKHWAFDSWKKFRLLKVLDGLSVKLISPSCVTYVGELVHLRYLSLTHEPIRKPLRLVSESLYQLHNLQTLIVRILSGVGMQFSSLDDEHLNQWYMKFEIWRVEARYTIGWLFA
ncbi:putative disease resistance RPP13-like protein 3 [Salvia splendens]|uniref:putative disease resistance RPP13-like protein 3 n=1 Tax=Salvia splendens TaxID=180675 RepID=UPI001C272500|nr:putative disease resistance RPP13-like protein 3 [Salvia splendens]